jgi:hypothetical protein
LQLVRAKAALGRARTAWPYDGQSLAADDDLTLEARQLNTRDEPLLHRISVAGLVLC